MKKLLYSTRWQGSGSFFSQTDVLFAAYAPARKASLTREKTAIVAAGDVGIRIGTTDGIDRSPIAQIELTGTKLLIQKLIELDPFGG
jgi:hypothetical protein